MKLWKLLLLGVLALGMKAGLAMVPPLAPLADPLLIVAVFAALPGDRWQALITGLAAGALDDALFGKWLGLHSFSQMAIAFGFCFIAAKVDLMQQFPALLAVALASLLDWGIQVGLALLFNRSAEVVPGPGYWLAAALINVVIAWLFYRLLAGKKGLS